MDRVTQWLCDVCTACVATSDSSTETKACQLCHPTSEQLRFASPKSPVDQLRQENGYMDGCRVAMQKCVRYWVSSRRTPRTFITSATLTRQRQWHSLRMLLTRMLKMVEMASSLACSYRVQAACVAQRDVRESRRDENGNSPIQRRYDPDKGRRVPY